MNDDQLNELLTSIEEARKIKRGELKACREFQFDEPDVKAIRERIGI